MSSNEVIDIDFEPDLREYPRHIRKSTERLLHRLKRPPLLDGQDEVLRAVLTYCSRNPNCDDIDVIVEQCHAFLNNKIVSPSGVTSNTRSSPNPSSNENDLQSFNDDMDSLVKLLPNHGKKAFHRFLSQKSDLEQSRYLKRVLYRTVKEFCDTYPEVENVHTVLKYIRNTLHEDHQLIDLLEPQEVDLTESSQPNKECIIIDDVYDLTTQIDNSASSSSSSSSGAIGGRTISRVPDAIASKVDILLEQKIALMLTNELRAVELVVQFMLEKGYEKVSVEARQSQKAEPDCAAELDYGSQSHITLTTPSAAYISQAKVLLEHNFPFLRVQGLQTLLLKNKNHYYPTMMEVLQIESNLTTKAFFGDVLGWSGCRLGSFALGLENLNKEDEQELSRVTSASDHSYIRAKCQMSSLGLTAKVVKASRFSTLDSIVTEEELKKELRWVLKKRVTTMREERVRLTEVNIQLQAELEGALIDCEQTVFGDGRSNLKCMDSSGSVPCGGRFSDATLKKVLSDKVFSKYQEALTRDALKAANIGNLVACFSCGMQVMMDDDAGLVLDCPSCGVEKKSDTDRRTKLEEAMTKSASVSRSELQDALLQDRGLQQDGLHVWRSNLLLMSCEYQQRRVRTLLSDSALHTRQLWEEDDQQAMLDAGIKTLADMQLLGVAAADQGDGAGGAGAGQNVDLQQIEKLLEGGLPKPKPPAAAAAPAAAAVVIPGQPPFLYNAPVYRHQHMQHGAMIGFGGAGAAQAAVNMEEFRRIHRARRRGAVIVAHPMPIPMPMMPQMPLPAMYMPPPAMPVPPQRPARAAAVEAHIIEPRGNRKRARFNDDGR
eukprot:gene24455-32905_t